jgi:hypothetical protein
MPIRNRNAVGRITADPNSPRPFPSGRGGVQALAVDGTWARSKSRGIAKILFSEKGERR